MNAKTRIKQWYQGLNREGQKLLVRSVVGVKIVTIIVALTTGVILWSDYQHFTVQPQQTQTAVAYRQQTQESMPTSTPWPSSTPTPTRTPEPTETKWATPLPSATLTATPTKTAIPSMTPIPTLSPEEANNPNSFGYWRTYFKWDPEKYHQIHTVADYVIIEFFMIPTGQQVRKIQECPSEEFFIESGLKAEVGYFGTVTFWYEPTEGLKYDETVTGTALLAIMKVNEWMVMGEKGEFSESMVFVQTKVCTPPGYESAATATPGP